MAGVVETLDLTQFAAWANGVASRVQVMNWAPALKQCKVLLSAKTKENFAQWKSPDGTRWLGLKRPRKRGRTREKPLRDRGILMASVTSQGPGHLEKVGANEMVYGTIIHYASYHQYGTKTIPIRAFLGWNNAMAEECVRILGEFLEKQLAGQGGLSSGG